MDAYIIIGDANARKSSTMRCLTGCFNRSNRDIEIAPLAPNSTTSAKVIQVYARVSSLQETDKGILPWEFEQEVLDRVKSHGHLDAVAFCLWSTAQVWHRPPGQNGGTITCPPASGYIQYLQNTTTNFNWRIAAVAVLGNPNIVATYPNSVHFPRSPAQPINVTAQDVRRHFNWT